MTAPLGPSREALYRSLVEDAFEAIATVADDLSLSFVNRAASTLLGRPVEDLIGMDLVGLVHPDDLDRALLHVSGWGRWGTPAGSTSFRLRHADGSWVRVDMTAASVSDGAGEHLAVYCRPANDTHAVDEVLRRLLDGASRSDALDPVLDVFDWALNGTSVAIAWFEPDGTHQFVTTGVPAELAGAEAEPGEPWRRVRDTGTAFHSQEDGLLDAARRELADRLGCGGLWIEPVPDPVTGVAALITVWGRLDGPMPEGHAYGMSIARTYVELILRWGGHVAQLTAAAERDPLTGVANRTVLNAVLGDPRWAGVVLYCDLDGFKAVNDRHGHAVGDEVLKVVASRIQSCVRADDLVTRIGGDEFLVLARGADQDRAEDLSERIRTEVSRPIDTGAGTVEVGIAIGLADAPRGIDEATLARADRALYAVKAGRGRA